MSDSLFSDQTLPSFSKIKNEEIYHVISQIINNNKEELKLIVKNNSFEDCVIAVDELGVKLSNAWSPVNHLNSVMSSEGLRAAYEKALPDLVQYSLFVEQNEELFKIYNNISSDGNLKLNNLEDRVLKNKIRDFKLSGAELSAENKLEFKQLSANLSTLTTKFNNNVLDCTDQWAYCINDQSMLYGIPEEIIKLASKNAHDAQQEGWLFGLDAPTYSAIIKSAKNRDLRSAFHYAYATRASKSGPHDSKFDNSQIMFEILSNKYKMARMLGFKNYAEYSLATKMVKQPESVMSFLTKLIEKARVYAQNEWEVLKLFAKDADAITELKPWDVSYYSELQKNKLFNLSDDFLKTYFPLDKVLLGFFEIINRLYGVHFKINENADTWHQDVTCYEVHKDDDKIIGYIYIDLFARPRKRNGAWMDECRGRCFTKNIQQLPVAYLNCNFTPKDENNVALLNHHDVLTLFHEFGHCLHHLLTTIDYPSISGINGVPWDAVELPSQFHENWCWEELSLPIISGHYQTGEPLPENYLKQLTKQKNYQSGLFLIRQLIFGLFDFKLHCDFHPDKGVVQIHNILLDVRKQVGVVPFADYDQFENSFSHIFAGGYAAGYYSYLWAEVLSANCFDEFKKTGIFNEATGQKFLDKILSKGGSIDINNAMLDFCGHDIQLEPFLKQYGLN